MPLPPDHTGELEYLTPHDAPGAGGSPLCGVCERLGKAAGTDIVRICGWLRRWWGFTTDPVYLMSPVSRRDLWKALLPLPPLIAMFADQGAGNLVVLDFGVAMVLLFSSCLPVGALWPDIVIAAIHTVYVALHGFWTPSVLLGVHLQVLCMMSMAAAGVHTIALIGFCIVGTVGSPLMPSAWDWNQILLCIYVLWVNAVAENRISQAVCDRSAGAFTYKSMNWSSHQQGGMYYDMPSETITNGCGNERFQYSAINSRAPHDGFSSRDVASDVEEGPYPPGASRSSLADYVLSRMAPADSSNPSIRGLLMTKLLPSQDGPRHRFAASQVMLPGAASHEAPQFQDKPVTAMPKAYEPDRSDMRRVVENMERAVNAVNAPQSQQSVGATAPQAANPFASGGGLGSPRPAASSAPSYEVRASGASTPPRREKSARSRSPSPGRAAASAPSDSRALMPPTPSLPSGSGPPSPETRHATPYAAFASMSAMSDAMSAVPSQATSPNGTRQMVFRGLKMNGFKNSALNVLFVENNEPDFRINDRETYWSATGDFFLYRSVSTNTWGAAKAKRFKQVREGKSNGVAHSPEGFEIWATEAMLAKKAWREWDAEVNKWETRPGSGVESRGKVRKRDGPQEVGTQTSPRPLKVAQTQTNESMSTQGQPRQAGLRHF